MEFEWDDSKNRENLRKHRISFEEAKEVFNFPHFTRVDPRDYVDEHGDEEIREITIGEIGRGVVVIVTHTEREGKIRIISARKAKPQERRRFYAHLRRTLTAN